jgi:hypothetical protein
MFAIAALDKVLHECNLAGMIWLITGSAAAVAQLSGSMLRGPAPVNYTSWPSQSGIPDYLFNGRRSAWTIRARLTVRPDGSVQRCEVERRSGSKPLDKFTCEMFSQRAKLLPATWADDTPSFGVFRFNFVWTRRDAPLGASHPSDVSIKVDRSIYAQRVPALVHVMFAVDANGQISDCTSQPPFDSGVASNPLTLVPLACDAIAHGYHPSPAKDDSGNPVRSVQNAFVQVRSN